MPDTLPPADTDTALADVPTLHEAMADLVENLERLRSASGNVEAAGEAARSSAMAAETVVQAATSLQHSVEQLVVRVDSVDFPSRLDAIQSHIKESQEKTLASVELLQEPLREVRSMVPEGFKTVVGRLTSASAAASAEVERATKQGGEVLQELRLARIVNYCVVALLMILLVMVALR